MDYFKIQTFTKSIITMNEQIIQIIALATATIGLLITFASGILIWTFKTQIKRIDSAEKENRDIKYNYIQRFDEIKEMMNSHNTIIQDELGSVKTDIALIKQKIGIYN